MDFPTLVYICPGDHQRLGGTFSTKPAINAKALATLLDAGYCLTLPEAIGRDVADVTDDNAPATREELETKAKELGVRFNWKTSDKNLAKKIADALD
jgi:hypothetical protein